jgi:drug/metabolite transporter (DMT)-like permease
VPWNGVAAVTLWGASFVATRIALEALTPGGLVAVRTAAGALLLGGILAGRGGRVWPRRDEWPACVVLGAVLAVHLYLQAWGLTLTSAVHTGWIIGFIPVTVAIGAHLLGQQRLRLTGWGGVALGAAGILAVMLSTPAAQRGQFVRGDLLQLASCVTWTVYTLAATRPLERSGALRATVHSMGFAALVVTVAAGAGGVWVGPLTVRALAAVLFLGPVCSGIAYYLWFAAQREHGPARTGALIYLEPFVSLAAGAVILGERVTAVAVVGGMLVLGGVWLVARGTTKGSGVPGG